MKKIIFLVFIYCIFFIRVFSQEIVVKINKISKNTYLLDIRIDTILEGFRLDNENSYVSIVDQDSIDLGNYEIFHFDNFGRILQEFIDKNSEQVKFIRLNLIFLDKLTGAKKHDSFYYELYVKEKRFLVDKDFLENKELKVYFNDNMLSRALIWNCEGKLVSALDIYSGVSEKIDFLHFGVYFLTLTGFDNTEKILIR